MRCVKGLIIICDLGVWLGQEQSEAVKQGDKVLGCRI